MNYSSLNLIIGEIYYAKTNCPLDVWNLDDFNSKRILNFSLIDQPKLRQTILLDFICSINSVDYFLGIQSNHTPHPNWKINISGIAYLDKDKNYSFGLQLNNVRIIASTEIIIPKKRIGFLPSDKINKVIQSINRKFIQKQICQRTDTIHKFKSGDFDFWSNQKIFIDVITNQQFTTEEKHSKHLI